MIPLAEPMTVPPGYGAPSRLLEWAAVRAQLEQAAVYWLASVRPDGRPHVVPRDGLWLGDALYYGGSPDTVHHRNVHPVAPVTMHIGSGADAVIVEGLVREEHLTLEEARSLAEASFAKYPQYGRMEPSVYAAGVLVLRPARVLAWTTVGLDATRFRFPS